MRCPVFAEQATSTKMLDEAGEDLLKKMPLRWLVNETGSLQSLDIQSPGCCFLDSYLRRQVTASVDFGWAVFCSSKKVVNLLQGGPLRSL